MPIEVTLIRRPYGFVPASEFDQQEVGLFGVGSRVRASLTQPRSRPQERFYRALVSDLAAATGKPREEVDLEIRVACGMVREVRLADGRPEFMTVSTKDMEQPVFNSFVESAQAKIIELFPDVGAEIVNTAWAKLNGASR